MKTKYLLLLISMIIVKVTFAQSCTDLKELLRKRHTIRGMTYGHPYTTFDRHNGLSLASIISNIRTRIINEKGKILSQSHVFKAYQKIYENANLPMPSDLGIATEARDDKSYLAIWAKNNAFVFLIGLDSNGFKLDSIDSSGATRNAFRDKAKDEAFSHLTGDIDHDNKGMGWVTAGASILSNNPMVVAGAMVATNFVNEQFVIEQNIPTNGYCLYELLKPFLKD